MRYNLIVPAIILVLILSFALVKTNQIQIKEFIYGKKDNKRTISIKVETDKGYVLQAGDAKIKIVNSTGQKIYETVLKSNLTPVTLQVPNTYRIIVSPNIFKGFYTANKKVYIVNESEILVTVTQKTELNITLTPKTEKVRFIANAYRLSPNNKYVFDLEIQPTYPGTFFCPVFMITTSNNETLPYIIPYVVEGDTINLPPLFEPEKKYQVAKKFTEKTYTKVRLSIRTQGENGFIFHIKDCKGTKDYKLRFIVGGAKS